MIEYKAFAELSHSTNSDERGHAAHLAALAYLDHSGPADEQAALYAALISFLDDPSVKVRAALAYGLLHSAEAPRSIMLALLRDSPVIARAVLQYSPVILDADIMPMLRDGDLAALIAISHRKTLSGRLAAGLFAREEDEITLRLLRRQDVALVPGLLNDLAVRKGSRAELRGAMLARNDLPAAARLVLVRCAAEDLRQCRMVKGSLTPERLSRILRDGTDTALTAIGETATADSRDDFVDTLVGSDQLNTRLLLHAIVTGHVMFFSACLANLAGVSRAKVFGLLEHGSKQALSALFARCGLNVPIARLLSRLVLHARTADLADDVAARHYVVTALTEELIAQYEGDIPLELEEAFSYLSEQNIALARKAARGVMAAFAGSNDGVLSLPPAETEIVAHLPAA